MIIEDGNAEDFKRCVLINVVVWHYMCGHRRVLDLLTIEEHGGRAIDFGNCPDCKGIAMADLIECIKEMTLTPTHEVPVAPMFGMVLREPVSSMIRILSDGDDP